MRHLLTVQDVADSIAAITKVNPLFKGKELFITLIANEKAGGFTQKSKSVKNKLLFQKAKERAAEKEVLVSSVQTKIFLTEYPGHAEELAAAEVAQFLALKNENSFHLIVACGGDGTSLEVQTGLYKASISSQQKKNAVMNNIAVFRLPMGTGNDGTDGKTVEESLAILEGPNHFALSKVVTVKSNPLAGENEWYSFNIASIGLDAYVVYKTNQMKSKVPGNSYHLWVNLSALGYNRLFPPKSARFEMFDENGNKTEDFEQSFEMLVFGLSGHRCYGGGHHILPNESNICLVQKVTSLEIAKYNKHFVDGSFVNTKIGKLYSGSKAVVHYDHDIFCQLDGEEHLLTKAHFPLEMSLSEPVLQILESDDLSVDKGAVRK